MKPKQVHIELIGSHEQMMKFLNHLQQQKVVLKSVVHLKKSVIFETNREGLRILRANRRKFQCRFTVRAKQHHLKLFSGYRFLLLLCIPYFASLFIWTVKVDSNHPEIQDRIEQKLADAQIKPLQLKSRLPNEDVLRRLLMEGESQLSWMRFEKQGVQFEVIPMASPQNLVNQPEKRRPSHLIAKTSGVITNYALTSGEQVASLHSTVKKGDLLATGILEQGEKEVVVGAEGAVFANYWLEYSFSLPRQLHYKVQGEEKWKIRFHPPTLGKNLFNKENWNIIETDPYITHKQMNVYLKEGMEKDYVIPVVKLQLQKELGYEAIIQNEELLRVTYDEDYVSGKIVFLVNDNIATYQLIEQGD